MRLESLGARTWLLVVLAGWAVLVWLLAVIGLGGRIAPHGDDAGAVPVLPQLPQPAPEPLRGFDQYAGIAAHPLFSRDRQPKAFRLAPEVQPVAAGEVRLTGVLITPELQLATLQTADGTSLRLHLDGPEAGGWRLLSLQPRTAVVAGPGGTRSLELQTYEGLHGAHPPRPRAPSPVAAPAPPASAAGAPQTAADEAAAEPRPLVPAATTQEQIDAIRQRIEERRQQLQNGQGDAPASRDTP